MSKSVRAVFFAITLIFFASELTSCSSTKRKDINYSLSVQREIADRTEANVATEAAASVAKSLYNLDKLETQANPQIVDTREFHGEKYGLGQLASVDWAGPVDQLLKEVASLSGYRFSMIGQEPAIPVIVSVSQNNVMLGKIFEDAALQANEKAAVNLYAKERLIELAYK